MVFIVDQEPEANRLTRPGSSKVTQLSQGIEIEMNAGPEEVIEIVAVQVRPTIDNALRRHARCDGGVGIARGVGMNAGAELIQEPNEVAILVADNCIMDVTGLVGKSGLEFVEGPSHRFGVIHVKRS